MKKAIERLGKILVETPKRLREISESESSQKQSSDKWSKKEILGHLIDSASNNHQRFVRAQLENPFYFPPYQQVNWINLQNYREESWNQLIHLWEFYNRHLLHVISNIPEDKWVNQCIIGTNPAITILFLAEEYVNHVEHHLKQILT